MKNRLKIFLAISALALLGILFLGREEQKGSRPTTKDNGSALTSGSSEASNPNPPAGGGNVFSTNRLASTPPAAPSVSGSEPSLPNVIYLNAGPINTDLPTTKARRQPLAYFSGKRLQLIQWNGPVQPGWMEELKRLGVEIVDYIPENAYLVYGDWKVLSAMQKKMADKNYVRWEGSYRGADKIQPNAVAEDGTTAAKRPEPELFAIQMVLHPQANEETLKKIKALQLSTPLKEGLAGKYYNIITRLPPAEIAKLAEQPDIISIGPYTTPKMMCERQAIIMAGQLNGNVPVLGSGYLAWLTTKGFTQAQFDASGLVVDVTDSPLDNGTVSPNHFALYKDGTITNNSPSRVVYSRLEGTANSGSVTQAQDGHGNLNAHIIGGQVNLTTSPHVDSSGYHFGMGICPFVRVGGSIIFDTSNFTSPNYDNLAARAYRDGARVSGNSWGADTAGAYDVDAQNYDRLVRDAQPTGSAVAAAGNQQMTFVFAAGNAGSGTKTVGSPGTAKNVITAGAAENVQPFGGSDSSGISDAGADSANDIISFSSRGPCTDSRAKPDLVAPGTHVSGGVPQAVKTMTGTGTKLSVFDGSGVSGGVSSIYFPSAGQQFYTASSGTSHSTPGIAGAAALVWQWFINQGWATAANPASPAMIKAYMMNAARYMTGTSANDNLYSNNQGMGMVNLDTSFDLTPRLLRDQVAADLFTASGQTRSYTGTIISSAKPVRITVAWTDAPGSTTGNAYKNNLDLTVVVNGTAYKGNVFSKGTSIAGGSADARNNVESVFLPAGTTGSVVITVAATNINSDGVPNNSSSLDQDFALVAYNVNEVQSAAVVSAGSTLVTEGNSPANNAIDPNEAVTVGFTLKNVGTLDAANVTATLTAVNGVTPGVDAVQNYGSLAAGGAPVTRNFSFSVAGTVGATFDAVLSLKDGTTDLGTVTYTFLLGPAPVTPVIISQVYGGGGNTGATYNQDYIELYNRSGASQSLAGWSVQYASAAGTSWTPTTLSGSIGAGKYFLVAMSTAGTAGSALPSPDATGATAMSATAGKVALVNSTTALSGANPVGTSGLQDLVGYGTTANGYEGAGPAPAPSATTAVFRAGGGTTDTDNNAADFTTGTPNPRNAGSVAAPPVITSTNAVSGFVGVSLSYQITASNGPTSFGASNLPTGLSVNTTNGLVSGAPTLAGTNVAQIFASNSSGTGTSNVTFTITPPQVPVITSAGTTSGTVGTAFSYTITASNSPTSFGASNLPAGLSVNSQSGAITGTPTVAGTNTAIIFASNVAGTGSNNLVIGIAPASGGGTVTYLSENFSSCTNGDNSSTSNNATAWVANSNFPTIAYAYQAGTVLKLGASKNPGSLTTRTLDLSANGGTYNVSFKVKGWTTVEGPVVVVANGVSNSVSYTATMSSALETKSLNLSGGSATSSVTFQTGGNKRFFLDDIVISSSAPSAAPTTITSATNVSGQVGTALNYAITADNSPSSFGVSSNLPAGLSLNPASGVISGTPTGSVTNVVTVSASNSFGGTSTNVTFAIGPLLPPVITSTNTTNGTAGQVFSYQITATNSPTSYDASNLPTGLSVNNSNGLVSGIPQTPGTNTVVLSASNAAGVGTKNLTLVVAPASSVITLAAWDVGSQTSYGTSPLAPTTLAANLSAVGLTRGSGLTTTSTASAGGWGANGWLQGASGTVSSAVAANQFISFSLTPTNGYKMTITNISKLYYRRSATGPTNGVLQVQVGTNAFADVANLSFSSSSSSGASLGPIDLSTNASLQNISNGVSVNFRLVNLGSTNVSGTWYVYKTSTTGEASLVVNGTLVTTSNVTPVISTSGTLGSVSTTYGTASPTPTSFRLSGENLAQGILVSAPSGYEVSATGASATDYAPSVTVGAAGALAPTTIYVRLAANTVPGTYAGNVQCTSLAATLVNVATASSTVAKKAISVSGVTANPKTYDGTTTATLTGSPGLVGVEGQDAANLGLGTPLADFVSANAGPDIEVVVTYSLTGSAAGYYTLTQPTGLLAEILAKPATLRANDQSKLKGTELLLGVGQTKFTSSGLVAGERIGTVTLTANGGTASNALAGTYLITPSDPVAPRTIPPNTFLAANYAFTYVDGTLMVVDAVTLSDWAAQKGLTGDNALPNADPDRDGMSNLMEFYLGLDPAQSGGNSESVMTVSNGPSNTVSMTYRRAKGISGVSAAVQANGDLSSASWDTNGVQETVTDKGDYEEVTATVTNPPGATRMFMRLKVSQP